MITINETALQKKHQRRLGIILLLRKQTSFLYSSGTPLGPEQCRIHLGESQHVTAQKVPGRCEQSDCFVH